jgi:hypothetical protein
VNDPQQGILVFDLFGTYARTLPILGARSFEVRGRSVFHTTAQGLAVYDMRSFETAPFVLEDVDMAGVRDARLELGRVYLLLEDGITILGLSRRP